MQQKGALFFTSDVTAAPSDAAGRVHLESHAVSVVLWWGWVLQEDLYVNGRPGGTCSFFCSEGLCPPSVLCVVLSHFSNKLHLLLSLHTDIIQYTHGQKGL